MMAHRFGEKGACSLAIAGIKDERAEIVERRKIIRLAAQQFKIIALGVLEASLLAEKTSALGARRKIIAVTRKHLVEPTQPRGRRRTGIDPRATAHAVRNPCSSIANHRS